MNTGAIITQGPQNWQIIQQQQGIANFLSNKNEHLVKCRFML